MAESGILCQGVAWLACHKTNEPFVWTCGSCLIGEDTNVHLKSGPGYQQMFDYMADTKLTVGINVPVHDPRGGLATVNALKVDSEPDFLNDDRHWMGPFTSCAYRLQAAISRHFDSSVVHSRHVRLSARELECLRLSARGYTTEQVADKIFRSVATAALHLRQAARKLGARNRAQAIARVAHYRLLEGAC